MPGSPIDPMIALSLAAVLVTMIVTFVSLRISRDWAAVRRHEIDAMRQRSSGGDSGQRIVMADLRERIRKLEAIAAGVDL